MHPAANEESASPAYAPPSGDLPSHHAQTGKGQRYLFVPATLAGKRASEVDATNGITAKSGRLPRGRAVRTCPLGEVRNFASIRPHIQPTPDPPDYRSTHFAEAALSGICSCATHICFRSRPKRFIDEAVLCRLSPCRTSTWRAKRNAYDAFG